MDVKVRNRLIVSGVCVVVTAALLALAHWAGDWFFSFYPAVSRFLQRPLAAVTGIVPFPVWEIAIPVLIVLFVVTLVRAVKGKRFARWCAGVLMIACLAGSSFVNLWGLNHFGPTIDERLGLTVEKYTVEQLTEATAYYLKMANALADQTPRNADGTLALPAFSELTRKADDGYRVLKEQYPMFSGALNRVKRVITWPIMSRFGVTGIFICLTGESSVNPDTYAASLPFTMCHELGHRMAVSRENEANFCAFLSCAANEDAVFQYSAYYSAFVYCHNALYKVSPATARAMWDYADERVYADCVAANAHYEKYEGKVQDAAQKVNDTYLKTFGQTSGVQSYGEVADLLISWYFAEKRS